MNGVKQPSYSSQISITFSEVYKTAVFVIKSRKKDCNFTTQTC